MTKMGREDMGGKRQGKMEKSRIKIKRCREGKMMIGSRRKVTFSRFVSRHLYNTHPLQTEIFEIKIQREPLLTANTAGRGFLAFSRR